MDTAVNILIVIAGITGSIMVLALFFTALSRLKSYLRHDIVVPKSSFIDVGTRVTLHMRDGRKLKELRFVGFTRQIDYNNDMPHELSKLMVFDTETGSRMYVPPVKISEIEQHNPPPAGLSG